MNDQTHHTSHVIRVDRSTYRHLQQAVASGQLQPNAEHLDVMTHGQIYRPNVQMLNAQMLIHDRELQLGSLTITGEFYRVPEQEYTSIITASLGAYRQYPDVYPLLTALLSPMTPADETTWLQDVRFTVAQGRQLASGTDMVDDIWTPTAWLRDRTRLIELGGDWFIVLYVAQPPRRAVPEGHDVIGVDIGLNPLATAAWGQQHAVTWRLAEPAVPAGESAEVRLLAETLTYAAARAALEDLMVQVLPQAGTLVLETIGYAQFRGDFTASARRRAVADWHQSWGPQRAYARGIRVVRVPAAFTSQTCSQCRVYTLGTRQGATFTCPQGHVLNTHINAARNLVRRYWGLQARARRRRVA
ncbi:zinc ribbon domain-containing protein [Deinococcus marmoris]|uniref:zinc ribbon domain-containing protein n=1 Tax=Deinococcus marmoris TaxID=249408 RepID=UPI000496A550|nr:zinc ribbon domain-containing protein [Deinococcus marmoris]